MHLLVTVRFRRAYSALTWQDQKQVQKALRTMAEDLHHPGVVREAHPGHAGHLGCTYQPIGPEYLRDRGGRDRPSQRGPA
jgi:hypothetical protein